MPSHRLLVRAGYVRQLGAGLYSLLPLGFRVTKRVEQVIREEMNAIGGQELEMPVVHPAEVWKDSGRYDKIGPELVRFKDRGDRDMVLAMTHEEVVALLLRDIVQSYRQLPVQLYHFQTKFRDEPRSRGGLIRVREFVMKDAYSCDLDDAGLDVSYRQAVRRLRDGSSSASGSTRSPSVPTSGSWADPGPTSSWSSTTTARTPWSCATPAATPRTSRSPRSRSRRRRPRTPSRWRTSRPPTRRRSMPSPRSSGSRRAGPPRPRSSSPATGGSSWPSSAATTTSTRRSWSTRSRRPAGCGPRRSTRSRPAAWSRATARRSGPATRSSSSTSSSPRSPNLVAGANRAGWHVRNVNVPRDYTPDVIAEITNAREGDACVRCGSPLKLRKGIEVGNIFKLGTDFTVAAGAMYLDEDGRAPPDRHGLVRHRARPERRLHRRGAPRREGDRLAGRGRAVSRAPRRPRREPRAEGHRGRRGAVRRRGRCRRPIARSCSTTATSRRASSSPTPRCSACPGS